MASLHYWSDIPGDWRMSSIHDATGHADGPGDVAEQVTSLDELLASLRNIIAARLRFDLIDFHTHGRPGAIVIGGDFLGYRELIEQFENRGFEEIFAPGARLVFTGCNVAEEAIGELFVATAGRVFLRGAGGTAEGNTGLGLAFTDAVWHPFGDWVIARTLPGGAVSLQGHTHLDPVELRRRAAAARARVASIQCGEFATGRCSVRLHDAESQIRAAEQFLGSSASRPPYRDVYDAYVAIQRAEAKLGAERGDQELMRRSIERCSPRLC